jgi:hypothetical protein
MSNHTTGESLLRAIRMLVVGFLKLLAIVFAWVCKLSGMILLKVGEAIENILKN